VGSGVETVGFLEDEAHMIGGFGEWQRVTPKLNVSSTDAFILRLGQYGLGDVGWGDHMRWWRCEG
jgi:hypothetical protein